MSSIAHPTKRIFWTSITDHAKWGIGADSETVFASGWNRDRSQLSRGGLIVSSLLLYMLSNLII